MNVIFTRPLFFQLNPAWLAEGTFQMDQYSWKESFPECRKGRALCFFFQIPFQGIKFSLNLRFLPYPCVVVTLPGLLNIDGGWKDQDKWENQRKT